MSVTSSELERLFEFKPRAGTESDLGFVLDTMAGAVAPIYGYHTRVAEDREIMREACRTFLVGQINAGATLVIAPAPSDDWVIWGWALARDREPLFVYVRREWRRGRIATRLLVNLGIDPRREEGMVTRWMTHDLRHIAVRGKWKVRHVPVL